LTPTLLQTLTILPIPEKTGRLGRLATPDASGVVGALGELTSVRLVQGTPGRFAAKFDSRPEQELDVDLNLTRCVNEGLSVKNAATLSLADVSGFENPLNQQTE
jgi:hypothetical protein